jgi:osomolarity two-component system sensor histidine kinase NIK1
MQQPETSAALARILSNFAKHSSHLDAASFPSSAAANGLKSHQITLPGDDTIEKRTLESELNSLAVRIQLLEAKAATGSSSLPVTPNEPLASAFAMNRADSIRSVGTRNRSASLVNSLLSKHDGGPGSRTLTVEQFDILREHIDQQAQKIESQQEIIDQISTNISQQETATRAALDNLENSGSIEQLKREIEKSKQINYTYQKVLREIGTIITAVANGDLSKKVLIHVQEKDPEIAKFKHTINKMVDQLQEFASQVTLLAKEVGTEGRLGGQAKVPGVAGIWADLTGNGKPSSSRSFGNRVR